MDAAREKIGNDTVKVNAGGAENRREENEKPRKNFGRRFRVSL
jgi:hypothetical protein